MVFYIASPSNQTKPSQWPQVDGNGAPLFMHEPLNNEQQLHPNSRKKHLHVKNDLPTINPQQLARDLQNLKVVDRGKSNPDGREITGDNINYRIGHENLEDQPGLSAHVKSILKKNRARAIPLKLLITAPPRVPWTARGGGGHGKDGGVPTEGTPAHLDLGLLSLEESTVAPRPGRPILSNAIGLRVSYENHPDEVDPEKLPFLINPEGVCTNEEDIFLIIAICSGVERFELRRAIRETWGGVVNHSLTTRLLFVIGKPREQMAGAQIAVKSESDQHGDILQLDLEDTPMTLSYKTLGTFHWVVRYCGNTRFLMKADDDVFINVPNVLQELKMIQNLGPMKFMLGHVIDGAKPITDRKDKWFLPIGMYKDRTYPPYLSGSAYVVPISLAEPILQHSQETSIFWLEDIYITGILAPKVNASLIHNSKFEYRKRKLGPCRFKMVNSAHGLSPSDLYYVWREMHKSGLRCSNSDMNFFREYDLHP